MSAGSELGHRLAVAEHAAQAAGATRPPRVALFGPYASRNLGDTATQLAAIANLRQRRSDLEIVGISPDPADTLASLGIAAFPLSGAEAASGSLEIEFPVASRANRSRLLDRPAALLRIKGFVGSLDMLIVSGGGQLDDFWGGAFGHPWSMLMWAAMARLSGVPVVFLAVGVDRLETPLSRIFARMALRLASLRSFRDAGSQTAMRDLGMRGPSSICPDLVFALPLVGGAAPRTRFAVINPITQKTWSHKQDQKQVEYLHKLAEVGSWLAEKGLALRIACSQTPMDGADAQRLKQMLLERQVRNVELCTTPTVGAYLDQVRGAEVVIGARLHGVILSLVAGSPVVALSPLPKVEQVMAEVGLAQFSLPLQTFRSDDLTAKVEEVLAQVPQVRQQIARFNADFRVRLGSMFDEVVGLLDRTSETRKSSEH